MYYIYQFIDKDNNILYVGKTVNLSSRMSGHNHLPSDCYEKRKKILYAEVLTNSDMCLYEKYYIDKLKPPYNTADLHDDKLTIQLPELTFKEYVASDFKIPQQKKLTKKTVEEIELEEFQKDKKAHRCETHILTYRFLKKYGYPFGKSFVLTTKEINELAKGLTFTYLPTFNFCWATIEKTRFCFSFAQSLIYDKEGNCYLTLRSTNPDYTPEEFKALIEATLNYGEKFEKYFKN